MKATNWIFPLLALALFSCKGQEDMADASGNFEADELIISAESQGRILAFGFEEGAELHRGEQSVLVDTIQLHLKKLHQRLPQRILPNILMVQSHLFHPFEMLWS